MFGYMDMLIVIKWFTNYTGHTDQAPSIITTMVSMFLAGGEIKGQEFFAHNQFVSNILVGKYSFACFYFIICLVICLACIPWMLCVKPYILYKENEKKSKVARDRAGDYEMDEIGNPGIQNYEVFKDEKVNLLAETPRPWPY